MEVGSRLEINRGKTEKKIYIICFRGLKTKYGGEIYIDQNINVNNAKNYIYTAKFDRKNKMTEKGNK